LRDKSGFCVVVCGVRGKEMFWITKRCGLHSWSLVTAHWTCEWSAETRVVVV